MDLIESWIETAYIIGQNIENGLSDIEKAFSAFEVSPI